ncbi:MAG TPA: L-aspartate oxidase [Phycisphaerae bacterium]|nr:L-aspartate oxidase [Phycisphaerae bacterium]
MDGTYLQRRYLLSFESRRLPHIFTDVLVIGTGAAGLRAALEAALHGQVIATTKGRVEDSNTYYAQGGLAAVEDAADTPEQHVADTLSAACGLGDDEVIRMVVAAAPRHVAQMRSWGVHFDMEGGRLSLAREGGHAANRIVHADGDATGRALADALLARARQCKDLKIFDQCFVIDLMTDPPGGGHGAACLGALTYHPRFGLQIIRARRTVLTAGGAGMIWRETTNPPNATADGIGMAFRAGVAVADSEMMQFHPTTLYVAGATRSLISEAVRGEGAYLVDRAGRRFMSDYHPQAELAPRDVVSRAILEHMAKTRSAHVWLDVRHLGSDAFAARFPQIDSKCRSFGIDPGKDLIPVHPAAHYMIGGAWVDIDGRTAMEGLYACGEAACTGLHGANRLASNSLTEALVFGERCGRLAGEEAAEAEDKAARHIDWANPVSSRTELDLADIRNSLRSVMWRNVGIVRVGERLAETIEIIGFWGRYVLDKEFLDPVGWEVQNMLTAAYLTAEGALRRTETRGVHYRRDFPDTDPVWARHQLMRRTEHQLVVE